jgi:hypothetical protein
MSCLLTSYWLHYFQQILLPWNLTVVRIYHLLHILFKFCGFLPSLYFLRILQFEKYQIMVLFLLSLYISTLCGSSSSLSPSS